MSTENCCSLLRFTTDVKSNKVYCKYHFTKLIEKRVRKTINHYRLLKREDNIALGYSGGKDSVTLLHILSKLRKRVPQSTIIAITIDEGIKGYRDHCIELTQKYTRKYQIPQVIMSFKEIYGATLDEIIEKSSQEQITLSACAICGILRRRALNYAAREVKANKIATAHNLDDEAQSIVMNLLRGDSKRFIRLSRTPVQVYQELPARIRPFVGISEPEIVLYAYANELEYHSYPCPYASSAMRNDVRAYLFEMEKKRPSTLQNIVNLHDSIKEYFPQQVQQKSPLKCKKCDEITTHEVCPVCQLLESLELQGSHE